MHKAFACNAGVPMETALPPEGCEIVKDFFRALIRVADAGKVNVGEALKLYRETYGAFRKHDSNKALDGRYRASKTWQEKYKERREWLAEHDLPNSQAAELAAVEWGINYQAAYQWIRLYRRQKKKGS